MEIINRCLALNEFRHYLKNYNFGALPANKLVIHHTWRPTKESWQGQKSIQGLKSYYEGKGWPAGPHLFIAEDGIWLFSPMRHDGIHAGELNHRSVGIEVVGDYDTEQWSGKTKSNALGAIKSLMEQLGLAEKDIFFHRDVSPKSCPGWAIAKEWLFQEISSLNLGPLIPLHAEGLAEILEATTVLAPEEKPSPSATPVSTPAAPLVIPEWAKDGVDFVSKNKLFEVRSSQDIRDAVKFYRFYQFLLSD